MAIERWLELFLFHIHRWDRRKLNLHKTSVWGFVYVWCLLISRKWIRFFSRTNSIQKSHCYSCIKVSQNAKPNVRSIEDMVKWHRNNVFTDSNISIKLCNLWCRQWNTTKIYDFWCSFVTLDIVKHISFAYIPLNKWLRQKKKKKETKPKERNTSFHPSLSIRTDNLLLSYWIICIIDKISGWPFCSFFSNRKYFEYIFNYGPLWIDFFPSIFRFDWKLPKMAI